MTKEELSDKYARSYVAFREGYFEPGEEKEMYIYCKRAFLAGYSTAESEIRELREKLVKAYGLISDIETTLCVPAAEYVPAIGDVFKLIDNAKIKREALSKIRGGEK